MGARFRSIKTKILFLLAVPLVALVTLWGFAVAITLGDSLRLLRANTYEDKVVRPTETLIDELQNERRMSLAFIGGDRSRGREGFDAQRARTDGAVTRFRRSAADGDLTGAATAATRRQMADLVARLGSLGGLRTSVDRRAVPAPQAYARFNTLIDVAEGIYDPVSPGTPELAKEAMTLIALGRAREVVSREDALLTGALAGGRFTTADHQQFVMLMSAHRDAYAKAILGLPEADQGRFRQLVAGSSYGRFVGLEDRLAAATGTERRPPVDLGSWHTASEAMLGQLAGIEATARAGTTQRSHDHASGVITRLVLAGGLGLIAVLVSAVLAVRIGRRLIRESRALAADMHTFARDQLPVITELARRGEQPDEALGLPARAFTVTEIDQIYEAFVAARQAVVTATVNESRTRRGLGEVFVNLARRSQALLHRQLTLLDTMERRAEGSADLQDLFQLDHLATRMRRHAEGLVILSGRPAGRTWRTPVPLVDVVRGAASEVEDYARVRVLPMSSAALAGPAVADTVHLLAELIENAMMFSPPASPVQVTGQIAAKGFVVEIEDRGLGMSPETLAEANQRLQDAPDFDPSDSARMGLFVVARLARRHDIKVTLRNSPYGGTAAIVLIPAALIVDPGGRAVEAGGRTVVDAAEPAANGRAEPVRPPAARALPAADEAGPAGTADVAGAAERAAAEADAAADADAGTDPADRRPPAGAPAGAPAGDGGDGQADDLPRRRRQASLAPQLRRNRSEPAARPASGPATEPAAGPAAGAPPGERSPEAASTMIAAMQRGWQRGRAEAGEQAGDLSGPASDGEERQ